MSLAEMAMTGARGTAAIGVVVALALGGVALWVTHNYLPHEHLCKGCEGPGGDRLRGIWLFVVAIAIHNFPEGLAVGIGVASGDVATGLGVTVGIGLQNMPEGLAVAAGLRAVGYSRASAFSGATVSGLLEPVGGIVGAGAIAISSTLLPWALAFAAGAMLFVLSSEVIPETHRPGREGGATAAFFLGFAAMILVAFTLD